MGTLSVSGPDGVYTPSGDLQRLLLSLLVARRAAWSSPSRLVADLWPGDSSATTSRLHLQIHRLRAGLGSTAIERGPNGYRLHPQRVDVDAWAFDDASQSALDTQGGQCREAALHECRRLWGGVPYPDVDHPLPRAEQHRLHELFFLVEEHRLQHYLDRGEHEKVLSSVARSAALQPTRERIHALWLTALYRDGSYAQALELYERLRRRLDEELGTVPNADLQALHLLVLRAHATAPPPEPAEPASADGHSTAMPPHSRPLRKARQAIDQAARNDERARRRRELALHALASGHLDEAMDALVRAETHYRISDQPSPHAETLLDLGIVQAVRGDLHRSRRALDEASRLQVDDEVSSRIAISRALVDTHAHHVEDAVITLERHRSVVEGLPRPLKMLWWRAWAQAHRRLGHLDEAVGAAEYALGIAQSDRPTMHVPLLMVELACTLRDARDGRSFRYYESAIEQAKRWHRQPTTALARASLAKAWLADQAPEQARAEAWHAVTEAQRCGAWGFVGKANLRLADAAIQLGQTAEAAWHRFEALVSFSKVDYPLTLEERRRLEQAASDVGEQPAAHRPSAIPPYAVADSSTSPMSS